MSKLRKRDENKKVTTAIINGTITSTVKDFCGLTKIRSTDFVNNNIVYKGTT